MFDYDIYPNASEDIFNKQCVALEKNIKELVKIDTIIDVDGFIHAHYQIGEAHTMVCNDCVVGAVYVTSDIELEKFFK